MKNEIAVVTGAGRGIGKEVSRLLFERGAKVALISRTASEIEIACREISDSPSEPNLWPYPLDVSSEAQVEEFFNKLNQKWGSPSILVNNAGWIQPQELKNMDTKTFELHFQVNVFGTFYFTRRAFQEMTKVPSGGSIVNVSSLGGIKGTEKFSGMSAYVGAKSAVTGLTEAWAVEGRRFNISVNAVAPGAVDTLMLKQAAPFLKTKTLPKDIAQSILFLCDKKSNANLTGAILEIHSNL